MISEIQARVLSAMISLPKKSTCDNVCKEVNKWNEQHLCDTIVCQALSELAEIEFVTKHERSNQKIKLLESGFLAYTDWWFAEYKKQM